MTITDALLVFFRAFVIVLSVLVLLIVAMSCAVGLLK